MIVVVVISEVAQHLMQLSAAGERGESTFYDSTTTTAEGVSARGIIDHVIVVRTTTTTPAGAREYRLGRPFSYV